MAILSYITIEYKPIVWSPIVWVLSMKFACCSATGNTQMYHNRKDQQPNPNQAALHPNPRRSSSSGLQWPELGHCGLETGFWSLDSAWLNPLCIWTPLFPGTSCPQDCPSSALPHPILLPPKLPPVPLVHKSPWSGQTQLSHLTVFGAAGTMLLPELA